MKAKKVTYKCPVCSYWLFKGYTDDGKEYPETEKCLLCKTVMERKDIS